MSVRAIVRIMTLRCREASELISRSQEGELTRGERIALRAHLAICGPCRRFRQQIDRLRTALRRLEESALDGAGESERLTAAARERLRETIDSRLS